MQVTQFTDVALKILLYSAEHHTKKVTSSEVADHHQLAVSHVRKAIHHLQQLSYIRTYRGKTGGIILTSKAWESTIGDIVRDMEPVREIDMYIPPHADQDRELQLLMYRGIQRFYRYLDNYTLEDVTREKSTLV
ncbi:Rrf2 family transcriptional regulator [Bacillus daqingensis]|uniref:HTH-type transcriptional regulator NsrR n=1 Tax=Bacillus daqingensis TaxID=872396 RepID=A0ABV9NVZ4_9BACI